MSKAIKTTYYPSLLYLIGISTFVFALVVSLIIAPYVIGASADGVGPWADEVVTSAQGTRKDGSAVNVDRSDSSQALGVAEATDIDGNFFSLGFLSGSITLKFTNAIYNGTGADLEVIESTRMPYSVETASIDVSTDGVTYVPAGDVSFDGNVSLPDDISCAYYVRITNTTNPDLFEDSADGFDVDGARALHVEGNCGSEPTPTPTPTPPSDNTDTTSDEDSGEAPQCTVGKPATPTITAVSYINATTVTVFWSGVSPVTHYTLSYGTTPGNYQYGVPNTGNVTAYTVGGLQSGVTYYFVVYAVNDCQPSDRSNEVSTQGSVLGASTGGDVLGASTTALASTGKWFEQAATLLAILGIFGCIIYFAKFFKKHSA